MGVIVRFKIVTTDNDPIVVQYGRTVVEIASDTYTTFALPNGDPTMFSVLDPSRVLKIIDDGSADRRGGTVDISNFPNVIEVLMRDSGITELLLGTVYPTSIDLSGNNLTSEAIDNILTTLDSSAVENGTFDYSGQVGSSDAWEYRSMVAKAAQLTLETKGWTITPAALTSEFALFANLGFTSETTVSITIETTDEDPVLVAFGDNTFAAIEHGVAAEHTYVSGDFDFYIYEPERVLSVDVE